MNKLIRNLIFIGLSAIVILYIINAFYDAFTREPIKNTKSDKQNITQDENNNSDQSKNKSSGKIIGNELSSSDNERLLESELTTDPSDNTFVDDDNPEDSDTESFLEEDDDPESDDEASNTTEAEDEQNFSESEKESDEIPSTDQGQTLRDNPNLRDALPEVPEAPENRSSDQEDSSSNQIFPDPVQEKNGSNDQFPNPIDNNSEAQEPNNSQFPSPNRSTSDDEQSSSAFPDPL